MKKKKWYRYIPGFRSGSIIKAIFASLYYLSSLIILIAGDISAAILAFTIPFLFFYGIDFLRKKVHPSEKKLNLQILGLSFVLFFLSGFISSSDVSTEEISENSKPEHEKQVSIESKSEDIDEKEVFKKKRDLKVHYIDVGQGDAIFIELPNGENMIIDGGPKSNENHLLNYLKSLEFDSIDYLVATHPHEDHIGGLISVLNNWEIENSYLPNKAHTTKTYENFLKALDFNGTNILKAESDTYILDEPGLSIKTLAPDPNTAGDDLNDYSVVLKLEFNDTSFMFTGDAEALTERYILEDNEEKDLKVNVLKIGHHGSKTSSTEAFISTVNPDFGVITCQEGNSFGYPHDEVLSILETNNVKIKRTDKEGTIIATSDGEKITWESKGNPIKANAPPKESKASDNSNNTKEIKKEDYQSNNIPVENNSNTNNTSTSSNNTSSNANTQQVVTEPAQGGQVYITPTGKKYHSRPCGRGNYRPVSKEEAIGRNLTPCAKCY